MSKFSYRKDGVWQSLAHAEGAWSGSDIRVDKLVSGLYYTTSGVTNNINTGFGDRVRGFPYYNALRTTYDRIAVQVTTAAASGLVRLGVYNIENGVPTSLVLDAGDVDGSTTGLKAATIDLTLDTGWYCLAVNRNNSGIALRAVNSVNRGQVGSSNPAVSLQANTWQRTSSYGALPDPFAHDFTFDYSYMVALRAA